MTISGNTVLQEKPYQIITIAAREKEQTAKLRVAAYCRVSTSSSDQLNSLAAQTQYYSTLIGEKDNWKLVDIYVDEGITGTSARKRPDFQRLLADCRRGLVDRVLCKSLSRFARNTQEGLEIIRELKLLGIGIFFEKECIDTSTLSGEMMTALFAAIAQAESDSISGNMRWSFQKRMQAGAYIPSSQPYGYALVNGEICIDLSKARVVCEVFSLYETGWSTQKIAEHLKRQAPFRPELQGVNWTYKRIARMLRNEKYKGDSLWQKSYRTDSLPHRKVRNHGEREQYYAENTHPAIIESAAFDRVQVLLDSRNYFKEPSESAVNSPFRGITRCACGSLMRRKETGGKLYRSCRVHDSTPEACPLKPVPEREIEAAFFRLYYKLKHYGIPILSEMAATLQTVRERRMLWSEDVIELNKKIAEYTSQNQTLAELNQQGLIDPDIFISQTNELIEQIHAAKLKKERLLATDSDNTIPKTKELIELLETGPELLIDFDGDLFGELVERITVDSNEQITFRLKNGLELPEAIERTVR